MEILFDKWGDKHMSKVVVTFSSTAPAHPQATRVAVYPALLNKYVFEYSDDYLTML